MPESGKDQTNRKDALLYMLKNVMVRFWFCFWFFLRSHPSNRTLKEKLYCGTLQYPS